MARAAPLSLFPRRSLSRGRIREHCGAMASPKVHRYPYPRPAVTVDVAVFAADSLHPRTPPRLRVLLIRRGKAPFAGRWALPGGFVDADEDLPDAARRELREETGLQVALGPQLGAYGTPGRDPRGHTVSVAYLAWCPGAPPAVHGLDDAVEADWHDARRPPPLAFDHRDVLRDALARLAAMADAAPGRGEFVTLLPASFGSGEAVELCAAAGRIRATPALRAAVLRTLRRCPRLRRLGATGREARFARSER